MELKAPIVCVLPFGNYGGNLCYMLLIFELSLLTRMGYVGIQLLFILRDKIISV